MTPSTTWKEFISNHPDSHDLCLILDKAQKLLVPNKPEDNFKILESSPSTILISFDSSQNSLVPSFMHQSIGNGLIAKDFVRMGLTGFSNSASPIILNPNTFSSFRSDKAPIPDWKDLINEKEEVAGAKVEII